VPNSMLPRSRLHDRGSHLSGRCYSSKPNRGVILGEHCQPVPFLIQIDDTYVKSTALVRRQGARRRARRRDVAAADAASERLSEPERASGEAGSRRGLEMARRKASALGSRIGNTEETDSVAGHIGLELGNVGFL
jgi:hypothetical protein